MDSGVGHGPFMQQVEQIKVNDRIVQEFAFLQAAQISLIDTDRSLATVDLIQRIDKKQGLSCTISCFLADLFSAS